MSKDELTIWDQSQDCLNKTFSSRGRVDYAKDENPVLE